MTATRELGPGDVVEAIGYNDQLIILMCSGGDMAEFTLLINKTMPKTGGSISTTDIIRFITKIDPENFIKIPGRYSQEVLQKYLDSGRKLCKTNIPE